MNGCKDKITALFHCLQVAPFLKLCNSPAWLLPAGVSAGRTAPGACGAARLPGPVLAASHGETPASPAPLLPCQHPGHIAALRLEAKHTLASDKHVRLREHLMQFSLVRLENHFKMRTVQDKYSFNQFNSFAILPTHLWRFSCFNAKWCNCSTCSFKSTY